MRFSKLMGTAPINSPLTREEIARRLDAIFDAGATGVWKRIVPHGLVYNGSHDDAGFTIERARTTNDAMVKLRGRYDVAGDHIRVTIDTVRNSTRSGIMWFAGSIVILVGLLVIVLNWMNAESVANAILASMIAAGICAGLIAILWFSGDREGAQDRLFLEKLLTLTEEEGGIEADRMAMLDAATTSNKRFRRYVGAFIMRTQLEPEEVERRIQVLLSGNRTYSAHRSVYKPQYAGVSADGGFRIVQVRKFLRPVQLDGTIRRDDDRTTIVVECRAVGWSIGLILQILGVGVLATQLLTNFRSPDLSLAVYLLTIVAQIAVRPSALRSRMAQEEAFLEKVLEASRASGTPATMKRRTASVGSV